ncbi:MAG: cupin domain-containing protein [Muribaculaceae bacterium]|nr:cupin domain-containing protein [Muribaculaceae bacterium]
MSELKTLNHGDKFAHVSVGALSTFEGKQFVKDATGATSCEISFGTLPTGASIPFFHSHRDNEENYIILSGSGRFQVDDQAFDIAEGSVVRVATNCDRNIKCTSKEPLVYICIQAREGSLGGYTMTDADVTERENLL